MQQIISSAVDNVLWFLGTYIPGFKEFHEWFNSLSDKQSNFYIALALLVVVAIYFYRKFQREDS